MMTVPGETHNGNVCPMCVVVIDSINEERIERTISLTTPTYLYLILIMNVEDYRKKVAKKAGSFLTLLMFIN